jgi:hypothetical protein
MFELLFFFCNGQTEEQCGISRVISAGKNSRNSSIQVYMKLGVHLFKANVKANHFFTINLTRIRQAVWD